MLVLLKMLQSLVRTLHSDGTPAQIAAGVTLGAALGLTPLMNAHNVLIVAALALLNVSFGAGMLAMALFAPLGFILDPVFEAIGNLLLVEATGLRPLWETVSSAPVLALFNLNNTVVLGSLVGWIVLAAPIYVLSRSAVLRYRATLGARVRQSKAYKAVRASRIYNVYSWFRE
jgi:uncharacterized protein (TIGR03546 family)